MNAKLPATATVSNDADDAPELTDAFFEQADEYIGEELVRRGRPSGSNKVSTTIRFDADVLTALKASGRGWQTRVNNVVREWIEPAM